ncbi:fatty-acid--CoA ligase [Rhodobacteraceae bacterium CCMM004]|nr:fatty-acid--CoA ligase [Rhodobacteraceae bacterium CCMM004]
MTSLPHIAAAPTAWEALERAAALTPGLEAVVAPDGRATFAELRASSARLARALAALGVGHGDRVGLCMGNSVDWIAVFLGLSRLGAVTVPVNTRLTAGEIGGILDDAGVRRALFSGRVLGADFAATMPAIRAAAPRLAGVVIQGDAPDGALNWATFAALGDDTPLPPPPDPDADLLIQYTSGTTSFPKAVPLTHRQMLANGFVSGQRLGLRAGDRMHSARPFFHVAGTTLSILACLQHQATLVTMTRFAADPALELMERERCTHFSGNGTMASMLLDCPGRAQRSLRLRGAWLAADSDTVRRVIGELGAAETVTGYGLSEASPNVAQSAWWEPEEIRILGAMAPQPGLEVRIAGQPLTVAAEGEIEVRGWSVMRGYLGRPDATAEVLTPDGWLQTGDLGKSTGDGRFTFAGRLKEIIRVGGENVSPAEVEAALCAHPQVSFAAAFALPDARLGDVPAAFCVSNAAPEAIRDWVAVRLASFKAPRHVFCVPTVDDIGLTASGKVQRPALAARATRLLEQSR